MLTRKNPYQLFFSFIDSCSKTGFNTINTDDEILNRLEAVMVYNSQFFCICDLIHMKFLYTSQLSTQMMGVDPKEISPYHFFEATHPDDIHRHSLGRSILFKMAQDFFIEEKGSVLLSTNLKIRHTNRNYLPMLFQCYLYYSAIPYKTVYMFQVHTRIEKFKKLRNGYHYYNGDDFSLFRYPDKDLLSRGNIFTDREFEIIRMIAKGLNSEQIAKRVFLSTHTVNTHRRNILKKSGKAYISELIYELKEGGIL